MCCIQISVETLLDNFFGSDLWINEPYKQIEAGQISQCGIFLINSLPGYVYCESDTVKIRQAAADMGYLIDPIERTICRGDKFVDRRRRNSIYSPGTASIIEKLVDIFVEERLSQPEYKIKRLKAV